MSDGKKHKEYGRDSIKYRRFHVSAPEITAQCTTVPAVSFSAPCGRPMDPGLPLDDVLCHRESSQIQLTSQVLPPSGEKDCSMRADWGERFSQT